MREPPLRTLLGIWNTTQLPASGGAVGSVLWLQPTCGFSAAGSWLAARVLHVLRICQAPEWLGFDVKAQYVGGSVRGWVVAPNSLRHLRKDAESMPATACRLHDLDDCVRRCKLWVCERVCVWLGLCLYNAAFDWAVLLL